MVSVKVVTAVRACMITVVNGVLVLPTFGQHAEAGVVSFAQVRLSTRDSTSTLRDVEMFDLGVC